MFIYYIYIYRCNFLIHQYLLFAFYVTRFTPFSSYSTFSVTTNYHPQTTTTTTTFNFYHHLHTKQPLLLSTTTNTTTLPPKNHHVKRVWPKARLFQLQTQRIVRGTSAHNTTPQKPVAALAGQRKTTNWLDERPGSRTKHERHEHVGREFGWVTFPDQSLLYIYISVFRFQNLFIIFLLVFIYTTQIRPPTTI